jgi:hypothetical protein
LDVNIYDIEVVSVNSVVKSERVNTQDQRVFSNKTPHFFLPDITHEPYSPSVTSTVNFNSVLSPYMSLAITLLHTAVSAQVSMTSSIATGVETVTGISVGGPLGSLVAGALLGSDVG